MRRPLFLRSAFLLLVTACATVPQPQQAPTRFKILQINDVYKIEGLEGGNTGGLARLRTLRTHLESDGTPVLVLHAGDALYPSVMSKYLDARPMVDVLNMLDGSAAAFDDKLVITFGNHEFDKNTPDILLARLNESAFSWVATNTRYCNPACDQAFPKVRDTMLLDAGGTKVGLFGLLYPLDVKYAKSTDLAAATRAAIDSLRSQGARVVIAITHQDMANDEQLAQQFPGIDLIVGGHDHLFMQQRVGATWVAKADADAKSVIVYDITVPPTGPIRTTPLRVTLDTTVPKDKAVDDVVKKWLDALGDELGGNETLGQTRYTLEGVEPAVRGRETALGNLLADVMRTQMQTELAFVGGGSIRINDNIPPGPITKYDMEGVFYYSMKTVAFPITGQQLLDVLRNSVSRVDAGDGRFLQVSGIRFTYRKQGEKFIVSPEDVTVGGKPIDLNARYTGATIDYIYNRGIEDGYQLFTDANRPPPINTNLDADLRTLVEAYIRNEGTIQTNVEGRITRAP